MLGARRRVAGTRALPTTSTGAASGCAAADQARPNARSTTPSPLRPVLLEPFDLDLHPRSAHAPAGPHGVSTPEARATGAEFPDAEGIELLCATSGTRSVPQRYIVRGTAPG